MHGEQASALVHVLFEIPVEVFEDEAEALLRVDDVVKSDDVGVFQVAQQ